MESEKLSLSFCITCKNRLHQIQQTLQKNLDDNREDMGVIEFILVDFGSTDGLQQWIGTNFANEIDSGYLKYYYTEELVHWHGSTAKNTAHILADNDIVVNLDCDNFTGPGGGRFVIDNMIKYSRYSPFIHQFSNEFGDGSHGRVAVIRKVFLEIRGYDESLIAQNYDDINLLQRLWLRGNSYVHLADEKYNRAIPNTKEEGMQNTNNDMSWLDMTHKNSQISRHNITISGQIVANTDKDHIGIINNIYTFSD